MKIVIFAGGTGTRLWPLSRKKSPKQFEKIITDKSTLQLTVERLLSEFPPQNIYVATNLAYKKIVYQQLPQIPKKNFIFEPEKKDVGPAIGLVMGLISKYFPNEPIAILWSDHLVKKTDKFLMILKKAGDYIKKNQKKIIFIAHKPRFPSTNLGYIKVAQKEEYFEGLQFKHFTGFKYKPDHQTAEKYLKSKDYAWNLGFFITTPSFLYQQYRLLVPKIFQTIEKIIDFKNKNDFKKRLKIFYSEIEPISFDHAIAENIDKTKVLVIITDIGWSDIGAWEALKESLETHPEENVILGKSHLENVKDSLIYNYESKKKIVALDLEEMIVVNTKDVLLITKKKSVSKLSKLIKSFEGTENENLI